MRHEDTYIRLTPLTKPQYGKLMAWTTRIVKIHIETGEVLEDKDIQKRNLEKKSIEKIYNKLTETHNETIIIQKFGERAQQQLDI